MFKEIENIIKKFEKRTFRKVVHMMGFLLIAGLAELLPSVYFKAAMVAGVITYITIELLRVSGARVPVMSVMIERLSRPGEMGWIFMPTLYFLISMTVLAVFFDRTSMYLGLIALSFGDAAAALVGERFGKKELFGGKTIEGSLAFFVVSAAGFSFFLSLPDSLITSAFATIIELVSYEYDNFTVPMATLIRFLL